MKKIICVGLMLAFSALSAFANIELDLHFIGDFYDNTKGDIKEINNIDVSSADADCEIKPVFSFGFEDDVSFYFGSAPRKFDAGISLLSGFSMSSGLDAKMSAKNVSQSEKNIKTIGIDFWFGVGPSFRYTVNEYFSIFLTPAFIADFRAIAFKDDYDDTISDTSLGVDINLGGRYWLVNKNGFHFGFDGGFQFDILGSVGTWNSGKYDIEYDGSRFNTKFYLGVCFNFGDRGIDR